MLTLSVYRQASSTTLPGYRMPYKRPAPPTNLSSPPHPTGVIWGPWPFRLGTISTPYACFPLILITERLISIQSGGQTRTTLLSSAKTFSILAMQISEYAAPALPRPRQQGLRRSSLTLRGTKITASPSLGWLMSAKCLE